MSALFQPYSLKNVTLRNRIAVPPMCQYSAIDSVPNDWHLAHYTGMARGGAGLVHTETAGTTHMNTLRRADIDGRFPGLLAVVLARPPLN